MVSFKVKINETTHDLNDIDGTNFIIDAKSKVENITGVPKSNQKWVYKGRILPDQMTITEANIIDGNTVIVMRTAQPQPVAADTPSKSPIPSPSQGNSVSPMNAANVPSFMGNANVPSFMGNVPSTARFDTAMRDLLNQNTDETVVKTTVSLLLKVISNIISNPLDAKYRRLNRTNAAFSKKVGSVTGGNNCMIALGFQIEGEEWVLTPNADAWNNIIGCQVKLNTFLVKLNSQVSSGAVPTNIPTENTPVAAPTPTPIPSTSTDSPSPLAMHQFLQSLAAMGGSLTAQPQPPQSPISHLETSQIDTTSEITPPTLAVAAAAAAESSPDQQEEEEETIPDL